MSTPTPKQCTNGDKEKPCPAALNDNDKWYIQNKPVVACPYCLTRWQGQVKLLKRWPGDWKHSWVWKRLKKQKGE